MPSSDLQLESWGRYPKSHSQTLALRARNDRLPDPAGRLMLPYGLGRSYGDSCLNDGGVLIQCHWLNQVVSFDETRGLLVCEGGMTLADLLTLVVPRGWFLPTTPGTKWVTVGGAIANDVHGKNHHRAGTFGCHVRRFELLRSDGSRQLCSPDSNPEWYAATVGGLGLTGVITWAEIQLRRIESAFIDTQSLKFGNLTEFFAIAEESDRTSEHTVAWIDSLPGAGNLGRGLFLRGNHAPAAGQRELVVHRPGRWSVPCDAPGWLFNPFTVRAFNFAYYHKQLAPVRSATVHYDPFFYPLDAVEQWNRIYGRRGFFQYQSVIPLPAGREATAEMLRRIARSGQASFLAVLKTFGAVKSPGLISFPRPGVTLALDFPNNGEPTQRLFAELDTIVREAHGRLYPAKDARMLAADFQRYYPKWESFAAYIDPKFSSSFWRRVTGKS